jgi:hypothetical protein
MKGTRIGLILFVILSADGRSSPLRVLHCVQHTQINADDISVTV